MLKKIFYTLLAGLVLLCFQIEPSDAQTLVIGKNGNVRSGPSTNDKIIGKVTARQEVTQIEKSGDWYKVKLPKGQVGWVNKILIAQAPASGSSGSAPKTAAPAPRPIDESTLGPAAPMNFSPVSGLMLGLFKVSCGTQCSIKGDTLSTTWFLVLNQGDVLELSKSKGGPGKPTGKVIYFDNKGGMDPAVSAEADNEGNAIIPMGRNLIAKTHLSGATYTRWRSSAPGEYGPLTPAHLVNFLGIGSTVRFPVDTWILFGDKQYRGGGFLVTQLSIEFLPRTEVKSNFGKFIYYKNQWRRIK